MRNRTTLALTVAAIAIAGGATTLAQRAGHSRSWRGSEMGRPSLAQAPPRAGAPANTLVPPVMITAQEPSEPPTVAREPGGPFLPDAAPPMPTPLVDNPGPVAARQSPAADPMADVEAFVARNRQEADRSVEALASEAEELKGRLERVEAALARWRQVSAALANEPAAPGPVPEPVISVPAIVPVREPAHEEPPTVLVPAPAPIEPTPFDR